MPAQSFKLALPLPGSFGEPPTSTPPTSTPESPLSMPAIPDEDELEEDSSVISVSDETVSNSAHRKVNPSKAVPLLAIVSPGAKVVGPQAVAFLAP